MSQTEHFGGASWQIDLGTGRRTEVEVGSSGGIWLVTGELTNWVDVWMGKVAGSVDLRVHVQRTDDGLIVAIDRGDNAGPWWRGEAAPRLVIRIDQNSLAEVHATIGVEAPSFADHFLGRLVVDH